MFYSLVKNREDSFMNIILGYIILMLSNFLHIQTLNMYHNTKKYESWKYPNRQYLKISQFMLRDANLGRIHDK